MDRPELERREVKDVAETEGARRATGVSAGDHPDPEVPERAKRRQFSAEYKLRILREADACKGSGEIGALLRREGLYSSHLVLWRRQRETRALAGKLAEKSTAIMRLGRDAFYHQWDMDLEAALEYLHGQVTLVTLTEDSAEGRRAFFEKRKPEFKGR